MRDTMDVGINRHDIEKLSALLEQVDFAGELHQSIVQHNTALKNRTLSTQSYLQTPEIAAAINQLQIGNHYLIPALLKIWWNQPSEFSGYEKILLCLSTMTLLTAAVLSHDFIVIFLEGKPALQTSARAIEDYCTTGLSERIFDICLALPDRQTAVFNMNVKTENLPSFQGHVSDPLHGPIPAVTFQSVPGWINSLGWITFLTCTSKNNFFNLTGHFYIDSLPIDNAIVQNGFPVMTTGIEQPVSPFLYDLAKIAMQLFFVGFCEMIKNGGYSTILKPDKQTYYGHFDGFQESAREFENNMYIFSGVYGGITLLALFILSGILINKTYSKWQNSQADRETFWIARQAQGLFKKISAGLQQEDTGQHVNYASINHASKPHAAAEPDV